MASKREQRLRRKARAALRATERVADGQRAELTKLRAIAHAAIRYVGEIDARNPHEPWSIANRRDELVDVVHAQQGRPERTRRDYQVVRAAAPVVQLRVAAGGSGSLPNPSPKKETRMQVDQQNREQLVRDIEVKRRTLHAIAQKFGAAANRRNRDARVVSELAAELDAAAKAFSLAEAKLHVADRRQERAAAEVA